MRHASVAATMAAATGSAADSQSMWAGTSVRGPQAIQATKARFRTNSSHGTSIHRAVAWRPCHHWPAPGSSSDARVCLTARP